MRARLVALAGAAALAAGALVTMPPAAAACAAPSSKYLAGTVKGQDGLDVNVQLGFALVSASGVPIGMDGCRISGYSASLRLNRTTSYAGVRHTAATTHTWRLSRLPSNAAVVWIESWPRGADGKLDHRRYGGSMRRKVPVNRGDVRVRLPLVCGAGGSTGKIWGRSYDRAGRPIALTRIHAWSEAPDSQTAIMGFGPGKAYNGNYYVVNALAANQPYVVWASATGYPTKRVYQVRVNPCKTTTVTIRFG